MRAWTARTGAGSAAIAAVLLVLGCAQPTALAPDPDPDTARVTALAKSYAAAAASDADPAELASLSAYLLDGRDEPIMGEDLPVRCLEIEHAALRQAGVKPDSAVEIGEAAGVLLVQFGITAGASVGRGIVPLADG
ncbi:MAG: hypothetical protein J0H64_06330, partial [Actinobacteria bacterium]|nr:hypothetical protein [Actinomycetota bacterium]